MALFSLCSMPAIAQTTIASPDGRRQMQAVQATSPIVIDGALDEDVWKRAVAATDFIQADPLEGQPASEITEVRIAYDADYLYVAALCRDSDPSGIVVNEIRKDFAGRDQDTFEVLLDTFADRRNGFVFSTNSARRQGRHADRQRGPRRQHQLGRGVVGRSADEPRTAGPPSSASRSRPFASRPATARRGA